MSGEPRPAAARIGITLLNLIAPGIGLVRLGRLRLGLLFLGLVFAALLLRLFFYAQGAPLGFTAFAALLATVALALLGSILVSMLLSWRYSRVRGDDQRPWWSRWYGLAGLVLLSILAVNAIGAAAGARYKTYHIPSESMLPALLVSDRLVVRLRAPADLRRGDVIVFRAAAGDYIHRVAALPGDRIAMRGGVVLLNGRPVPQRAVGRAEFESWDGRRNAAVRLAERFPGEAREHHIYDLGERPQDDMPEQRVAPNHLFVLGDNRDMAADSRIPRESHGVEQLPIQHIKGLALFILWSGERGRIGAPLSGGDAR